MNRRKLVLPAIPLLRVNSANTVGWADKVSEGRGRSAGADRNPDLTTASGRGGL